MNLSIVIPAHNEEKSIQEVVKLIERKVSVAHEVLVVNDHSTDNTEIKVRELCREYSNVRLVNNELPAGFANALRAGFRSVKSDMIVPVMADLCDEPTTINKMYALAMQGFDIVCGSRYMKDGKKIGGPAVKTVFSFFVGVSLNFLIGIPTRDTSNSFKLYRKVVLDKINTASSGFEISLEIPLRAYFLGYKIIEIPTTWTDRKDGKSKFSVFKQGSRYFKLYAWAIWKKLCSR